MKYLEELENGDCFELNSEYYIATSDFKKTGSKLCIQLKTGYGRWLKPDETVNTIDIFTFDKDSNIIAIRERAKEQS
jgi:hypothetical protein